jgi:putative flippase GtrA
MHCHSTIGYQMLSSGKLAINYAIFASIATAANIAMQDIVVRVYHGSYDLLISIVAGTAMGLLIKYLLDKRFIFHFHTRDLLHNSKIFMHYCFMGLLTTAVFLGFEFGFNMLFETKKMRYLGAVIGLAIGYFSKYQLDKRYVFRREGI